MPRRIPTENQLPLIDVDELELCPYCGLHLALPCDVPPVDICDRALAGVADGVAVLVTPPLCPMGGNRPLKSGAK